MEGRPDSLRWAWCLEAGSEACGRVPRRRPFTLCRAWDGWTYRACYPLRLPCHARGLTYRAGPGMVGLLEVPCSEAPCDAWQLGVA